MNTVDLLGKLAKDKITGFKGVIVGVRENLYGCDQVRIQPRDLKSEDGSTKKAEIFDLPQVEISDNVAKVIECTPNPQIITLGSKVKDPITEVEGIAVLREVYLNGCSGVGVMPPKNKDGDVKANMYAEERLQVVQAEAAKPGERRHNGGPEEEMHDIEFNTSF